MRLRPSIRPAVLRAAVAAGSLTCVTGAHAYRMIQTPSAGRVTEGAQVSCASPAGFVHWPSPGIAWYHNTANQGAGKAGALAAAMQSWTDVPNADHVLSYADDFPYGFATDNRNTVVWASGNGCTLGCLALTALVVQQPDQVLLEADVTFNDDYDWNSYDTQAVAAHEFGHTLGLHHTDVFSSPFPTMVAGYFGTGGRTLEADDAAGLQCAQSRYGAVDASRFLEASVRSTMLAGRTYPVYVTMHNIGATTWTQAEAYRLGSQNPQDNLTWGLGRVLLPHDVGPNQSVRFNFNVTAPSNPGTYNFRWRMLREMVHWFGAFTPNVPIQVREARLIASYVPYAGAPRTSFTSTSASPPAFHFHYQEAAGHFEQRPGGPCNTGQDNQTYLMIRFDTPAVQACTFQASWDPAPFTCGANHVATVNSGQWATLDTDRYAVDPATCALFYPLRSVVPFNQPAWFKVDLLIDGAWTTRRVDFIKDF